MRTNVALAEEMNYDLRGKGVYPLNVKYQFKL